jgi:uncharacterized protein YyaL (SSP411 family)
MSIFLATLLLCAPAFAAGQALPTAAELPAALTRAPTIWHAYEPHTLRLAREQGKGLLLYFHAQWCTWCRSFQARTLDQERVAARLQRDLVPVAVDVDRRRDLFDRFGGKGLPYTLVTDSAQRVLLRFSGDVGPDDLIALVDEAISHPSRPQPFTPARLTAETLPKLLEDAYDADSGRLAGTTLYGPLTKRPQPPTLLYLLRQPEWRPRMPKLLSTLVDDLADPVAGGFFYFHDPTQADPLHRTETSKVLSLNALLIWVLVEGYEKTGDPRLASGARAALAYLDKHLWDPKVGAYRGSQYSDPVYYRLDAAGRRVRPPPRVERVYYTDANARAAIALFRAAEVLEAPELASRGERALDFLQREMAALGGGYFHYRVAGGPPRMSGYLADQAWTAAALAYRLAYQDDPEVASRLKGLLSHIDSRYAAPGEKGYRDRAGSTEGEAFLSPRNNGLMAWLHRRFLASEPSARRRRLLQGALAMSLSSGGEPDDIALGLMAGEALPRTNEHGPD